VEYVPVDDGVFNLPEPFGLELTTKHASMWQGEGARQAAQRSALIEELRNPTVLSTVVADLRDQVAKLTAQIADHEVRLTSKAARGGKSATKETVIPEPTPAATPPEPEPEPSDESREAEQGDGTEVQDAPAQDETVETSESDGESSTDAKPERARKTVAKKAATPKPTG